MDFSQRVVVLTGAGGGIGASILAALSQAGATRVAADRDEAALQRTGSAPNVVKVEADVGTEAGCRAVRDAAAAHGRVDILINNAGYFPVREFEDISYAEWSDILRVNLDSVFLMTQGMLPFIKGRGWGRIINVGSASVFRGVANQVHYVTAKAGMVGFTRSLARALGPEGITVNVITPGLTASANALATFGAERLDTAGTMRALPRTQLPTDVVGAALFLASPLSDFITGQIINVDGGSIMH